MSILRRTERSAGSKLLRLLLNLLLAFGLWWLLDAPSAPSGPRDIVVLTEGATRPSKVDGALLLSLPGVQPDSTAGIRPVPDLGSALRELPGDVPLLVLGHGLRASDRAALDGRQVRFEPSPLPPGIIELEAPASAIVGRQFSIRGRLHDLPAATVELQSPGGQTIATRQVDASGRFLLPASAPVAGLLSWSLRVLPASSAAVGETTKPLEQATVAVQIEAAAKPRIHVLAGGPDPELKYLRRWALDLGLTLSSRIALTSGISSQRTALRLDAATLDALDLLVLDERSWAGLASAERAAVSAAVERGLGLLLRLRGVPNAATLAEWRKLGFAVAASELPRAVVLRKSLSLPDEFPNLSRQPLDVSSADARALLTDDAGAPLALWRAQGRGRIGLWWLEDSFKLRLNGQAQVYGNLWGESVETLARARGLARPEWHTAPRVGEKAVVCGLPAALPIRVKSAAGTSLELIGAADPQQSGLACAAWWPRESGWQQLAAGEEQQWPVSVRSAQELPVLQASERLVATQALATASAAPTANRISTSRWSNSVAMLIWLALASVLWWLERRLR